MRGIETKREKNRVREGEKEGGGRRNWGRDLVRESNVNVKGQNCGWKNRGLER